jgi:hypothetical protein
MNTNKRTTVGLLMTLAGGAMLIALCLLQPATVQGQWTTADGSGNINNTNTNNVGVGTTAPNYKVDVTNSSDKTQFRFGMGSGDSGGFLYSNGASQATLAGGASVNNGWFARSLSASIIEANLGQITFYANSGLSTGSAYTPTARMRITSGGLVGIGTTSPNTRLHVVSGTDTSTSLLSLDTGVHGGTSMSVYGTANNESGFDMAVYRSGVYTSRFGVNNSGNLYLQPGGGNVGVGTTSPDQFARLHISGSGGLGQDIQTTTNDWSRLRFVTPSRTWGFFLDGQSAGLLPQGSFGLYDYNASAFRMVFSTAGNVGVGTQTPGYKLDVGGSVNASSGLCIAGDCKSSWASVGGTQWTTSGSTIYFNTGNVGVGTQTPGYKLDVGGSVNASTGLCIAGDCKSSWASVGGSQWTTSGSTIFYNTGNVGIGLPGAPTRKLEVLGGNVFHQWSTSAGSEYGFYTSINNNHLSSNLYFDGQWKMASTGKGAFISAAPGSGWAFNVWGDNTVRAANTVASGTHLFAVTMAGNVGVGTGSPVYSLDVNGSGNAFRTKAATVSSSDAIATFENNSAIQMIVRGNGNVGIATTSPTEKLEVTGNVKVSGTVEGGNIKAKYQDVAEWVESSQDLSPGTVVVLDSTKSNQVIAATRAYDSTVAGVISLQPGIALGEQGEGRVLVATTGRVRVRVDATNGPINIGDLLVTSDREGFAMKSLPVDIGGVRLHRPGTLIGKALEPLARGTGEILVLLSLQ